MAGFNLADVLSAVADFQQNLMGDKATTAKTLEENQALQQQQIDSTKQVLANATAQSELESAQKLEMEKRKKATAQVFGTDILDPNNRIAVLAREQQAAQDEFIQNSRRAAELKDITLTESPLDYFLARPFAFRHDEAAVAAAGKAQFIDKAIMDINQQTQATVQTQTAINQTFTADMAARKLENLALTAAEQVRTLKMNQNVSYLNDLKTLRGMDEASIKNSIDAYKLVRHEQEFNARMEEMAAAREARKAAGKQEKLALTEYMAMYNFGAKELGKPIFTDAAQFTAMLKYNKDMVEQVASVGMGRGIDPANPEAQTVPSFVARTPGESVMTLRAVKGTLPSSAERTAAYLAAEQSAAQEKVLKSSTTGKITGDQVVAAINQNALGGIVSDGKTKKEIKGTAQQMQENMEQDLYGGRVKNIYRAPDVNTVADVTPELTRTKWWSEIIAPAANTSPSPTADQVMKQAAIAVKEGKLKPEEAAAGIASYFKAATAANVTNEQYLRVGLPVPKAYNVIISGGMDAWTSRGTGVSIDMLKEDQIKHRLMLSTMRIPGLLR